MPPRKDTGSPARRKTPSRSGHDTTSVDTTPLRCAMQAARGHGDLAIKTLASIADDPDMPATARVAAAVRLLERGFGRPAGADPDVDLSEISDADLERMLSEIDEPDRAE